MEKFILSVSTSLINAGMDPEDVRKVVDTISMIGVDYDIMPKETAIVPYDETDNQKLIKQFLATKLVEGCSKKTVAAYGKCIQKFAAATRKGLTDIKANDVRAYLAEKEAAGCKMSYLASIRDYISSFYKWALEEEYVTRNPCAKVVIKEPQAVRSAFSDVEMDRIRDACRTEKERAMVEVLVSSGVRCQELCDLEISDIDYMKKSVHVRCGKGGKGRITYLSDVAMSHLQEYINGRPGSSIVLFDNARSHGKMTTSGVRMILNGIGDRAGVENVFTHRFRHTFASMMIRRGMPVEKLQILMGHESIDTTMRYVHSTDREVSNIYAQCA